MSDHHLGLLLVVFDILLRGRPFRSIPGIGMSFFFFVFLSSKSCELLGPAWLGFRFYSFEFPSSCLALRISMGPSRSYFLRIGVVLLRRLVQGRR